MTGRDAGRARRRKPARAGRAPLLALLAVLGGLAAGCADHDEARSPVRLAELVAAPPSEAVEVTGPFVVGREVVVQEVDLSTEAVVRLRVRATSMAAPLVELSWRLVGEERFAPYRALIFPVEPDGDEHVYLVDLRREPYWTGRIAELGWRIAGEDASAGEVSIAGVIGLPPGDATRVTSLKGVTLPTLPGSERLELTLPQDAPPRAALEAWLGLLPRFERPGVTARFRAWVESERGGREPWLDEVIRGGELPGWRAVRREVEIPPGAKLVLEVQAERYGRPLPEGAAVWGAPVLVARNGGPGGSPSKVLVIVVDTLRADVLGSYGDDGGLTPRLDKLAARSVRFADAVAPSPWTLPSVATLLTGQPPQIHGAGRRVGEFAPTGLGPSLPTLAESFAAAGWYTAAVYNNIYLNPAFGLERGFDEYSWVEEPDDAVVDRALERLVALADRRSFFLLHLFGPHHPYEPPPAECDRVARSFAPDYDGPLGCSAERFDVPTLTGELPPERDRRWIEGLYRAEVAFTDAQIGRLLDRLAELGLAEDTVVLVVSDHGEAFWDRLDQEMDGGYEHSDHGHTHYRELVRVPAILHLPGSAARIFSEAVQMSDWMPTLLAIAGIDRPPTAGVDLGAILSGHPMTRRTLIADALLYGPSRWAARRGPWKLVVPSEPGLPVELYDLAADPAELRDLSAERPGIVAALRAHGERELAARERLRRRLAGGDDALESTYLEWNHITKLRSLGYLR